MNRHLLFFAAFNPKAQERLRAVLKIILHPQVNRCADPTANIGDKADPIDSRVITPAPPTSCSLERPILGAAL